MEKYSSVSKYFSLTALGAGLVVMGGLVGIDQGFAADSTSSDGVPKGAYFDDDKNQQYDDRDSAASKARHRRAPSHEERTDGAGEDRPHGHEFERIHDDRARPAEFDRSQFGGDPDYSDLEYDAEEQIEIYGGKTAVPRVAPLIEWPKPMYQEGEIGEGWEIVGRKNPVRPQLIVFGDIKSVIAYNDNGAAELGQAVLQANIDINLQLTATERIHAFTQPFQDNNDGTVTRHEFSGGDQSNDRTDGVFAPELDTLFFEGDMGAIISGLTDEYTTYDLPFAFGLFPLFYQNGIWADDDVGGFAFTIPSLNSPTFDISNMDFIFFYADRNVSTKAVFNKKGKLTDKNVAVYGFTTTIEALAAYTEIGIGYIEDEANDNRPVDFSYTNVGLSFTKRYRDLLSYSVRFIGNFGQNPGSGIAKTADGELYIVETSLITSKPSTLVPYANFWYGTGKPRSLIRDNGGILKNIGINFETDALTGFPKLDDTGEDTFGGAIGVMNIFALNKQLILEVATVQTHGDRTGRAAQDDQYAIGARYQLPLDPAWILRLDAMYGELKGADDISGTRVELRRKF